MKFRILLFSITTLAIGAAAWFSYNGCCNDGNLVNAYIPRSQFQSAQGIQGAFEFYKSIKSNIYTGEIEAEDYLQTKEAVKAFDKAQGFAKNTNVNWTSVGPTNIGGRTRAILPFPNDVNTLIAGGVSGGLFKSTNGGQKWNRIQSFDDNLAVSTIAMIGNGAIYVGTGHSRESIWGNESSGFMGGGLYVSVDQGENWAQVSDFTPNYFNSASQWSTTNKIVADGSNPDRLWIGTNFGLFPYIHGSADLGAMPTGATPGRVEDLAISKDGQNLIVAISNRVYISTDFGANFVRTNGDNQSVFPNTEIGSIDLDIAPDNKDFMVASVPKQNSTLRGIYATENAGQTWYIIAPSSNDGTSAIFSPFTSAAASQGNYDNMITIAPGTSANGSIEIVMGGIKLYKYTLPPNSTPGISLWENINANFASSPGQAPSPFYVHSDIHTSAWDADGRLYIGCDGGIFRSSDRGATWVSLNNNFVTTQFYAIAFTPTGQILGGTQDNGTPWISLSGANPGDAVEFTGGDGFTTEISQVFPNYMFSTIYNGAVFRTALGGQGITTVGNLFDISNGGGTDFNTDIALHENENNDFSAVYIDYHPVEDDPYIQFLPNGGYELTSNGDTIIGKVPAGTQIVVTANDSPYQFSKVLTEDLNYYSYFVRTVDGEEFIYHNVGDTTKIKELSQFMLAAALSNGIYVTRKPLKTNGQINWYKVSASPGGTPSAIEFSPDGDHLYVGYSNGKLIRLSGFNSAWTEAELKYSLPTFSLTKTEILDAGATISDIEVDYSLGQGTTAGGAPASKRVVVSLANYGGSGKIRISDNAATATDASSFQNAWNVEPGIQGMPCYSVVMDKNNPNVLMAGTEFGIYYSDNSGASWTSANNGDMNRVPVFDLRQQKKDAWKVQNSGVVYAGSHGRGVFRSDYLLNPNTGLDDDKIADLPSLGKLKIFPNPVTNNGTVQFDLGVSGDVSMNIYSIDGRLVESRSAQKMEPGQKKELRFNAADLAQGTYLLQIKVGNTVQTSKFVKTR